MDTPYFLCEDCGHLFEKTAFLLDVEDDLVACPAYGGLDIQLVQEPAAEHAPEVRGRRPAQLSLRRSPRWRRAAGRRRRGRRRRRRRCARSGR